MLRWLVERRLSDVSARLRKAREELDVVNQQLAALADDADETRLRAIVSDSPMADHEHRHSQRSADAMAGSREQLTAKIRELEKSQDELLDKLASRSQ